MKPSEVAQAMHYKRGDYNLVLWALSQGYNISIWNSCNDKVVNNSHDYQKICNALVNNYKVEIVIIDRTENNKIKGWALAITDNEDEDIISDFSANKFMDKWEKQFTQFHEELNEILNRR